MIMNTPFLNFFLKFPTQSIDPLNIEAIGLHYRQKSFDDGGVPIPSWRVMMFHTPVEIRWNNDYTICQKNDLFIFPPNTHVRYSSLDEECFDSSWVRFAGTLADTFVANHNLPCNKAIAFDTSEESDLWVSLLLDTCQQNAVDHEILHHLFNIWLKVIKKQHQSIDQTRIPGNIEKSRNYIEIHYLEKLSLSRLAQEAGMSKTYFCNQFSKHYKISPGEYQIRLKLQHAVHLLENRNLNISDIADQCGYKDVYYFSRQFKERLGRSPNNYRKEKMSAVN